MADAIDVCATFGASSRLLEIRTLEIWNTTFKSVVENANFDGTLLAVKGIPSDPPIRWYYNDAPLGVEPYSFTDFEEGYTIQDMQAEIDNSNQEKCIFVNKAGNWTVVGCDEEHPFFCVDMTKAPNPTPAPTTPEPTPQPTEAPTQIPTTGAPTVSPTEENWLGNINEALQGINGSIFAGIMLGCGPILCLFGKKLFKFIIFLVGFAMIGWFTLQGLTEHADFFNLDKDSVLYISLGVGVAGGGMLVFLTKLSIIVCGAAFGVIGAQALWQILEQTIRKSLNDDARWVHIGMLVITGLIGAFLAYKLVNAVLKIATAFIGAFFTVSGGAFFVAKAFKEEAWLAPDTFWTDFNPQDNLGDDHWRKCGAFCGCCYAIWVILFVCGTWYQYRGKNLLKSSKEEPTTEEQAFAQQLEMQRMMMAQPHGQPMQPMMHQPMPAPNPMFSNVQINLKKRGQKKQFLAGPGLANPRMSAPVGYAYSQPSPALLPQQAPGHHANALSVGSIGTLSVASAPAYVQRAQPQIMMVNQHGQVIGSMPRQPTPVSINLGARGMRQGGGNVF